MSEMSGKSLPERLIAQFRRVLGDDNVVEIEADREGIALFWGGAERVPVVVAFLARLIVQHHRLEEVPRLGLFWGEEGARERLIESSNVAAFACKLIDWLSVPCLDILRLEVPAEDVSIAVRFEGTASRGMVWLSLESPDLAVIRDLAEQLGEELGVCFRL